MIYILINSPEILSHYQLLGPNTRHSVKSLRLKTWLVNISHTCIVYFNLVLGQLFPYLVSFTATEREDTCGVQFLNI